jgi:hypothetical protein
VAVVIVVPIALFILATQRYLVRGLTLGGEGVTLTCPISTRPELW